MKKFLILAVSLVSLSSCGTAVFDERQSYIDASVEAMCLATESFGTTTTGDAEYSKMLEIYSKNGFPVENQLEMEAIFAKYQAEEFVVKEINEKTESCRTKAIENFKNSNLPNVLPEPDDTLMTSSTDSVLPPSSDAEAPVEVEELSS